jgi:hypothetical protein
VRERKNVAEKDFEGGNWKKSIDDVSPHRNVDRFDSISAHSRENPTLAFTMFA